MLAFACRVVFIQSEYPRGRVAAVAVAHTILLYKVVLARILLRVLGGVCVLSYHANVIPLDMWNARALVRVCEYALASSFGRSFFLLLRRSLTHEHHAQNR